VCGGVGQLVVVGAGWKSLVWCERSCSRARRVKPALCMQSLRFQRPSTTQ
jgi:hypothetical protein